MKIKANVSIGLVAYEFEIEERDEMDTIHKAAVLCNPRRTCNCCGNADPAMFKLDSNKDKEGNTYVNVMCKCGAKSKLGQYKVGGYFWHEYEVYQRKES